MSQQPYPNGGRLRDPYAPFPFGAPQHQLPVSESIEHAEQDPFVRALLLAEDMEVLKAAARNEGDAARAVQYSQIETFLLQAAAGIQAANDQKVEGQ